MHSAILQRTRTSQAQEVTAENSPRSPQMFWGSFKKIPLSLPLKIKDHLYGMKLSGFIVSTLSYRRKCPKAGAADPVVLSERPVEPLDSSKRFCVLADSHSKAVAHRQPSSPAVYHLRAGVLSRWRVAGRGEFTFKDCSLRGRSPCRTQLC